MKTKLKSTGIELNKLIVHIDNSWSAREFLVLFDSIERLYGYAAMYEDIYSFFEQKALELNRPKDLESFPELQHRIAHFYNDSIRILSHPIDFNSDSLFSGIWHTNYYLQVSKIKYGSKGSVDFLGLGKLFEILKDLVIHYVPNKEKRADIKLKEKDIEMKEQEIISKKIENLKKVGLTRTQIQALLGLEQFHIDKLKTLLETGNITDMKIIKETDTDSTR